MILNRQRSVRVSVGELDKFLERALRYLQLPPGALTVCLVDNAKMARWNRSYRGKKGPTDVLSFPTNGTQPKRTRLAPPNRRKSVRAPRSVSYLGDIAIAPAVARRNARRFGRTFSEEMRILILHGILHLMGYDHETDTGQMDRREQRLRRECGLA
ncbi:MAG TPA: rRNA maturation RNase YbeY [Candidatus Limnocylindria bacterium]|nr:rRNA maturation RNase YbeY [Candidatus Limnocylindria bacterium]